MITKYQEEEHNSGKACAIFLCTLFPTLKTLNKYIAYAYGYDCALGSDACSFEAKKKGSGEYIIFSL